MWSIMWKWIEIIIVVFLLIDFVPKVYSRIKVHANECLKEFEKRFAINMKGNNERRLENEVEKDLNRSIGIWRWEDNEMQSLLQTVIDIVLDEVRNNSNVIASSQIANDLRGRAIDRLRQSINDKKKQQNTEKDLKVAGDSEWNEELCNLICRRRSTVSEIARKFENSESKVRVHMASSVHITEGYFDNYTTGATEPQLVVKERNNDCDILQRGSNKKTEINQQKPMNGNDCMASSNGQQQQRSPQSTSRAGRDNCEPKTGGLKSKDNNESQTEEVFYRRTSRQQQQPTEVDAFDEILKQQRFSRRLSAYSISEFLTKDIDCEDSLDEIINAIGMTRNVS